MNHKILIILILCLSSIMQEILAQPVYRALVPGEVITNKGEVLKGKIMIQRYEEHAKEIVFYDQLYVKQVFTPADIEGYSLEFITRGESGEYVRQQRHFVSKSITTDEMGKHSFAAFLEREVEGPLRLYRYFTASITDKNPRYRLFVQGANRDMSEIKKTDFVEDAKEIFSEYPELAYAVGDEGYSFHDMRRMVRNYNLWLSRR